MKKFTLILSSLLLVASLVFVGCKKDKEEEKPTQETTIQKMIQITGAELVSGTMPAASSSEEIEVQMGSTVIPGGTFNIAVNSPVEADKIYVAIEGQSGYYAIPVDNEDRDYEYNFLMIVDQSIDLGDGGSFNLQVAVLDINGNVTQIWDNEIELHTVGTGNLQVSLTFDQHKDIDLILKEPNGTFIGYFNSVSSNGGELDLDANAGCSNSSVWAENITYGDEAYVEPGTYYVYVDMYSNCSPHDNPTNFTLSVFYQGVLIATSGHTNPMVATFPADEPSNYTNLDNISPAMSFVIPDHGQSKTKSFAPAVLSEEALEKIAEAHK